MSVVRNCGVCLVVAFFWDVALSLKITGLYVPRGASHDAPIDCRYDLEGEPLYDVKWYKDDMQFFRCMADGSVHEFSVEGVSMYYSSYAAQGSCPVVLTGLTSKSAGNYKCEVSLDAPTFRTVSETKTLRLIQSSRRTQQQQTINTEKAESFQNTTGSLRSGVSRSTVPSQIYLLLITSLCCNMYNKLL